MAKPIFKKGHVPWNKGKKNVYRPETVEKMKLAKLGVKRGPHSPKHKEKISLGNLGKNKGKIGFWRNKKRPNLFNEASLKKLSINNIGKHPKTKNFMQGNTHTNWKGGVSKDRHKVNTLEYRTWVASVFQRDNWTCQTCRVRGVYLQAHHIKGWAKYPEFRFDVNNGVTLCVPCHKLTDNFAGKKQKL